MVARHLEAVSMAVQRSVADSMVAVGSMVVVAAADSMAAEAAEAIANHPLTRHRP